MRCNVLRCVATLLCDNMLRYIATLLCDNMLRYIATLLCDNMLRYIATLMQPLAGADVGGSSGSDSEWESVGKPKRKVCARVRG